MTVGAQGNWGFVLSLRGGKLAGLVLVGTAVAISTVLFQTLTENRILTPAVMGFDALYVTIQTAVVFALGAQGAAAIDPRWRFAGEALLLAVVALGLFRWLFDGRRGLHLVVLAGLVFGILCRGLSNLLQRVLDPNEFAVLQGMLFARFSVADTALLPVAAGIIIAAGVFAVRLAPTLDVLALGREPAVNLGIDHKRMVTILVIVIAVLVSVSTALVGPVLFFGLLVSNLAYLALGTDRHRYTLPAAALIAVTCLAAGQTVLERVLGYDAALSVVIEFAGGIVFILLLLRGTRT
ncbi:iron chelate uptake ABC transporter family permease subunit [Blastochloris viridis]|uniref:Ferric enterobactin transport system permease protein fepD n=1 Tax=Blastochloris viridis TaxID=1079 RepID=A0A0H5BAE2_BLAVI|nr:iron chelate uptake ABC transporter family permease subunit [Blastochloris viridis]BAR99150.1 iron compound ABC uptake transporter permease protein PiuC [Blastochloris viridis]CUU43535.1 Ferric enterobactin transport system permease protein fepD [Blastochloris viridis]